MKWLLDDQRNAKLSLFLSQYQITYQTEQNDKMTALRPNDSIAFTFFMAFSNSLPNWDTFVKYFFFDLMLSSKSDEMTAVWPIDS